MRRIRMKGRCLMVLIVQGRGKNLVRRLSYQATYVERFGKLDSGAALRSENSQLQSEDLDD